MSDLKVKPGQPIRAASINSIVDRLPGENFGADRNHRSRLILCRTTEDIDGAVIDSDDTEETVYSSGLVETFGLVNNGDGTFSPGLTNKKHIMINAASSTIPGGTELWASESTDGVLVSTVWIC